MSKILIVAKTRMTNNCVCVGGIDMDKKISVRLLDINGYHESVGTCPFNILEIWDIEYSKYNQRPLPHSEDICVINNRKFGVLKNEISMLDLLNRLNLHVYQGSIFNVFEQKLKCKDSKTFYISKDDVPNNSTCFWICDREIRRDDSKNRIRYYYNEGPRQWYSIPYVGLLSNTLKIIPQGTLVRLSLAHWWSPEDSDAEERCYLQLSGWYE